MNGAQFILSFLEQHNSTHAFGYPGGAIMPLYDALLDSKVKHYLARHEQGAAFAAIGYARSRNRVGVCFGTSGPGATNLLTAIADANLDSVPLLVITGQVASQAMGSDAFQEVDVLGLSLSITKHSAQVNDISQLPRQLAEAYHCCTDGRPGPVLLDIPKDILLSEVPAFAVPELPGPGSAIAPDITRQLDAANQLLQKAKKPLVYAGGGIAMANALNEFREFLEQSQLPVVATLKGLGSTAPQYPHFLGMLGMHGLKAANQAVQSCDVLLVIGARLDDRATGKLQEFAPFAKVIHIDVDAAEIGKRRFAEVAIATDCKAVLPGLKTQFHIKDWLLQLQHWQVGAKNQKASALSTDIPPNELLRRLDSIKTENTIITCDVGQHQMWVAQNMSFATPKHHLTSGGLGTMGFGLPAAIGASVGNPDTPVLCVSGDGSFMMNVQELATINRYQLPVKIIILDNQRLGMVKQWQELFHEERYSETDLSCNPDFASVARAFGIEANTLNQYGEMTSKLNWLMKNEGAALLHVKLNSEENVWPIVPPNCANHNMLESHNAT